MHAFYLSAEIRAQDKWINGRSFALLYSLERPLFPLATIILACLTGNATLDKSKRLGPLVSDWHTSRPSLGH